LIEILNKGAEGGIYTTCALQTLADLAKRLGSEDAARMALGNFNNLIALRSKDRPTQDFVVETFVVFVTPITVPPWALAAIPPVGGLFLSRVVANFHRRG